MYSVNRLLYINSDISKVKVYSEAVYINITDARKIQKGPQQAGFNMNI